MERKTAILAKEFRRYDIDIVALSETHLLDEGKNSRKSVQVTHSFGKDVLQMRHDNRV